MAVDIDDDAAASAASAAVVGPVQQPDRRHQDAICRAVLRAVLCVHAASCRVCSALSCVCAVFVFCSALCHVSLRTNARPRQGCDRPQGPPLSLRPIPPRPPFSLFSPGSPETRSSRITGALLAPVRCMAWHGMAGHGITFHACPAGAPRLVGSTLKSPTHSFTHSHSHSHTHTYRHPRFSRPHPRLDSYHSR